MSASMQLGRRLSNIHRQSAAGIHSHARPHLHRARTPICFGKPPSAHIQPATKEVEQILGTAPSLDIPEPGFDSIQSALEDLAVGKFVVVLDDADRENEGDLIMSADKCTPEALHFMVEYTSGVICIGMRGEDLDRLKIPLMVNSAENEEALYTAFTVTVDLWEGITTGISASDRAKTLAALASPDSKPSDFRKPGHIFPLRSRRGGVLARPGHTEAGVDLARLAGCFPGGALCEIVDKRDGSMARTPQLLEFAKEHNLKCITIADLIRYRLKHDVAVQHMHSRPVDTQHGTLQEHTYRSLLDGTEHVALTAGDVCAQEGVLTRVHVESMGEGGVPPSRGGASSEELDGALQRVAQAGRGVVLYLRQPSPRSVEELNRGGGSGVPMELLRWGAAVQMLRHLGVDSVELIGGKDGDAEMLGRFGVRVGGASGASIGRAAANGVNGTHAAGNGVNGVAAGAVSEVLLGQPLSTLGS